MKFTQNQLVKVKWNKNNKKQYESLGYVFTEYKKELVVRLQDISLGKGGNYRKDLSIEDRISTCEWCNHLYLTTPSVKNTTRFCSKKCRVDWYAKDWSQSKEWRDKSRIRAAKILSDGLIEKTNTGCQIVINDLLEESDILFENEYNCHFVTIDNYLIEYNLMIEVMGTYWHADPRIYSEINYQAQFDRIIHDKRKRAIIQNNYGINVLYLWENDISNNLDLCKKLIDLYIKCEGVLKDYNSFNYNIKNNEILLNEEIVVPYFEKEIDYLKSIFIIKCGEKRSLKQEDKWITFNCQHCNKEKEQLKTRYYKSNSHFCSQECKKLSQQHGNSPTLGGVPYDCDCCGKEYLARNYLFESLKTGERQNLFCSYECAREFRKGKKIDKLNTSVIKECKNCKKNYTVSKYRESISKYCGRSCKGKDRRNKKTSS